MVDICVVTYNRLEYLKNCIWSILASTKIDYRLIVLSDNSTDGTNEWLLEMKKHNKIDEVIINETNLGSVGSFNKCVKHSNTEYFVMICDDMWLHRGWDESSFDIFKNHKDCGIVTFFNFPINENERQVTKINEKVYKRQLTGLAGTIIKRELYDLVGGFYMPPEFKMGYWAKDFCTKALSVNSTRKYQYLTNPFYAEQMDRHNPGSKETKPPKLSQEYLYKEYNIMRSEEKRKFKENNK